MPRVIHSRNHRTFTLLFFTLINLVMKEGTPKTSSNNRSITHLGNILEALAQMRLNSGRIFRLRQNFEKFVIG